MVFFRGSEFDISTSPETLTGSIGCGSHEWPHNRTAVTLGFTLLGREHTWVGCSSGKAWAGMTRTQTLRTRGSWVGTEWLRLHRGQCFQCHQEAWAPRGTHRQQLSMRSSTCWVDIQAKKRVIPRHTAFLSYIPVLAVIPWGCKQC